MKSKFLIVTLLLCSIGFSAFAQKSKPSEPISKSIHLTEAFTSLAIEDDISVVLTESNSNEIIIKGDERSVKTVSVKVDEGRLVISYLQPNVQNHSKVYVPAALLTRVNINGKSELTSASILSNPKLRVTMAGEGKVHIRSNGKIFIEGTDGFDFIRVVR